MPAHSIPLGDHSPHRSPPSQASQQPQAQLFLRLPADDQRIEELLPDRWAAAHPEAILNHRLQESRTKDVRKRARRAHRRKTK